MVGGKLSTGRWVPAVLLLAVVLAGCSGANPNTGTIDAATTETTREVANPPPEDTTAPESPQQSAPKTVSVSLPGLPIGGNSQLTDDPAVQCVSVGWSGPPAIPDGVTVTIGSNFTFHPAAAFTQTSANCPDGTPSCWPGTFRIGVDGGTCSLAVRTTGVATGDNPSVEVTGGTATCAPDAAALCDRFRDAVAAAQPQAIGLQQPPAPDTSSS
jgi:hypothetical protein